MSQNDLQLQGHVIPARARILPETKASMLYADGREGAGLVVRHSRETICVKLVRVCVVVRVPHAVVRHRDEGSLRYFDSVVQLDVVYCHAFEEGCRKLAIGF